MKKMGGEQVKIRQTSTLEECINCFDQLSNQTHNWSEVRLMVTSIKGLRPKIRREIKAQQPRTMIATISLVIKEDKRFGKETYHIIKVVDKPTGKASTSFALTCETSIMQEAPIETKVIALKL